MTGIAAILAQVSELGRFHGIGGAQAIAAMDHSEFALPPLNDVVFQVPGCRCS
jgi:hypothetical protein